MHRHTERRLSLASKFYLALVLPLLIISLVVTIMTFRGLDSNARSLSEVLRFDSKANRILSLLLVQDDASKAMLIDPGQLEYFSSKKIEAYDEHKKLLTELNEEAREEDVKRIIMDLQVIDETKLRPIDSEVLEKLFEDVDQARTKYFQEYEVEKKVYESRIRQLAAKGSTALLQASQEQHHKNLKSLLQIGLALLLGIGVVIVTIRIMARQVEKSEENTQSLLAVLNEGLFFFDAEGKIPAERSKSLLKILPDSGEVTSLQDFFLRYARFNAANVDMVLDLLWNKSGDDFYSDPLTTLSMLPHSFHLDDGRILQLDFRLLLNATQKLDRVVVVVADVTQKIRNEREAVQQAERVRKISRAASSFDNFFVFLDEAIGIFRRADILWIKATKGLDKADEIQLKRDLHTLKGSLGAFEFAHLASRIHELESKVAEEGFHNTKSQNLWEEIKDQWKFEITDIEQVLGLSTSRDKVSIQKSKLDRLAEYARLQQLPALIGLVEDCTRYPISEALSKYQSYLGKICERMRNKQVRIIFAADSADLAPFEVQKIDSSLVHLLRNCLDHGIEDVETRASLQKDVCGLIQIACYRLANGELHLVIKDDGRGIDSERLVQKALNSSIWSQEMAAKASMQEKIDLIFVSQLSTKDEVSDISGRGVGMDAVKSQLEAWGGRISVYSQSGQGTQFEIDIPASASQVRPQAVPRRA